MSLRLKSWLLALALSAVCAGIVACLNLMLADSGAPELVWLTRIHVVCAFAGALAFARFIQGVPAALKGSTSRSTIAQGVVAANRTGTVNLVVPGKSAFFSTGRCMMLICFMVQFVRASKPADDPRGSPAGTGQQTQRLST